MFGYKAFNSDMTCRGFQYEVGKEYSTSEEIELCRYGFHFCENIIDCFLYYSQPNARFAKVEALGRVIRADKDSKCVTDRIRIVEEIPMDEAVRMANTGKGNAAGCVNSGNFNSGSVNSGDRNSGTGNPGSYNSGGYNSGDRNSGNHNSGDYNSGHGNSGNCNSGDENHGGRNSGNWNSGNRNSGDFNTGDFNTGHCNSGDKNSGGRNSGNWNTGRCNSGYGNSGSGNTGSNNSGSWNSGRCNSGNHNSGSLNSGDWNSGIMNSGSRNLGNRNTGDWNRSSNNSGCFMSVEPKIMMFNRPSDWTFRDWQKSRACSIMSGCPTDYEEAEWVFSSEMTDADKAAYPEYKTTGGYLKTVIFSADRQAWWDGLDDDEKKTVMGLPNFDPDVFYECTGIRV